MTDPAYHIVPRMRDTLERMIAWLTEQESASRAVLERLEHADDTDDALIDALESLSKRGAEAERSLFEEYRILRAEWESQRESLPERDRDAMNQLGEQMQALSFSTHDLYNRIAESVSTFAERDRSESGRLHHAANALRQYRSDGGEDNRGFNIRA